jgi:uncharacterized membrane protein YhaH (DUF805 family)
MSKPVFEDVFLFSGRRNRKSYILFSLAQLVGWVVLAVVIGVAAAAAGKGNEAAVVGILVAAAVPALVLAISGWAGSSQRCRDFGWTGWALLITLIPYVGWIFAFALWLVPGNQGDNRYGPDLLDDGYRPPRRDMIASRA